MSLISISSKNVITKIFLLVHVLSKKKLIPSQRNNKLLFQAFFREKKTIKLLSRMSQNIEGACRMELTTFSVY